MYDFYDYDWYYYDWYDYDWYDYDWYGYYGDDSYYAQTGAKSKLHSKAKM